MVTHFFHASFGTDHQLTEVIIIINNSNSYEITIIILK